MTKFSEETLNNWRKPPSVTEKTKLENAERMVREAIEADSKLSKMQIDIFGQGSYANDTNVRLNSDIDINVLLSDYVFVETPPEKSSDDYNYSDSDYPYSVYKNDVHNALIKKFGGENIRRDDKCITVLANSYRVETDVVPTLLLKRHDADGSIVNGVKFVSDSSKPISNYPIQHIENGISKNEKTQRRFKRLTRIFRKIRYKMKEDNIAVNDNITSFLLECLVWNIPDHIFNDNHSWTDRLRASIVYLYEQTKNEENSKEWGEVSELLYLFRPNRKWSVEDVNSYLVQMWQYLDFD